MREKESGPTSPSHPVRRKEEHKAPTDRRKRGVSGTANQIRIQNHWVITQWTQHPDRSIEGRKRTSWEIYT